MRKLTLIVVSLALTFTSNAQAHPKFLWHHAKMSTEQKVHYFQRSIERDKWAVSFLVHRRSLTAKRDLHWYKAALRWYRQLYDHYSAKLTPVASVAPTNWVAKQIWVANKIGGHGTDPWPNCPDPFDGGGSWSATVHCENGDNWYDSPGYYRCGLQFDPMWERKYGALCP